MVSCAKATGVAGREAERIVAGIGAERRGIVNATAAISAGVTPPELRRLRERGVLVSLGRGVDRLRDHPFDWHSRCRAALDLAGPTAVLGPRPSARLHEFYAYRRSEAIEVYVPRGRDHRTLVGRVLQTAWLPESHTTNADGFPVLNLGRTFFGLCAQPDHLLPYAHPAHRKKMRRVYNDALGRRGLTFAHQAAVLSVTAKRGRRGTSLVRSILLEFPPDHEPTESETEFLFLELLDAHRITAGARQVAISDDAGFVGVVDFCWRDARLVVEIDSTWHDGPVDRLEDAERDARLEAAGWTVKRYRYRDLVDRPTAIAAELRAHLTNPRIGGSR
jgi:very-short-patch-repair endonuclease